ncbi:hypothetical protein LTS10_011258 [Elasticomyces elasticus]|nr:hypothetical protein LTS10_011258 [Elasticomyces elasticus]
MDAETCDGVLNRIPVGRRFNPSQTWMARRVYKRRPMVALEEFFERSYGLSFYDATYTQLVDAAGLGCKLCDRILQCLRTTASDDGIALGNELPEDSVIAARVDEQSRRLELVTFDTSTLRVDSLLGLYGPPDTDEAEWRDDNWYDMVTVQGAGQILVVQIKHKIG